MVAPGRPMDLNGVGLDMVKTGSRMIGVLQQHQQAGVVTQVTRSWWCSLGTKSRFLG
jgi:hypothetical protein